MKWTLEEASKTTAYLVLEDIPPHLNHDLAQAILRFEIIKTLMLRDPILSKESQLIEQYSESILLMKRFAGEFPQLAPHSEASDSRK